VSGLKATELAAHAIEDGHIELGRTDLRGSVD
jgi:hypothetical protein